LCQQCKGTGKIKTPLKLALDIGAGGTRRQWPGHKTYTTDVRPETKPDYVQDMRLLNLPDEHYDLIASSHSLEHVGRWDQEAVWREMARVLKPGGRMEHIVPSLDWAAAKIKDGKVDSHTLNVLYGAQEAHGYAREWNVHYFGYTKAIACALAEQAGLVDVVCRDWRDDEKLSYNLVITGRKPAEVVEEASTVGMAGNGVLVAVGAT
jgi:SAM-dependent methyltransferase